MPAPSLLVAPIEPVTPDTIVVMGVTGCGKTTIGRLLANRLGVPYVEADTFHPASNVEKMTHGIPLTDQDREPWLAAIAQQISQNKRLVVSCSALKRRYRDLLRTTTARVWFLHLIIDQHTAADRVANRATHFMPTSLVTSQFEALQPLHDEAGLTVDATQSPEQIITTTLSALNEHALPPTRTAFDEPEEAQS